MDDWFSIVLSIILLIIVPFGSLINNFLDKMREYKFKKFLKKNEKKIYDLLFIEQSKSLYNNFIRYVPRERIFQVLLNAKNKLLIDKLTVCVKFNIFIFNEYLEIKTDKGLVKILDEFNIQEFSMDDLVLAYIIYYAYDKKEYAEQILKIKRIIVSNECDDWVIKYKSIMEEFFLILKINEKESYFNCFMSIYEDLISDRFVKDDEKDLKSCDIKCCINGHNIIYIDESHKYFVDGKEVPSVSTILKKQSHKHHYDDYYKINEKILTNAANEGTRVHRIIQEYEENAIYNNYSPELENYIKVKKMEEISCLKNEIIVLYCSKNNEPLFCGRVDMVILKHGSYGILDLKRTSKFYLEKFTLQINLYRMAYMQSYGVDINYLYCLRLRGNLKDFRQIRIDERFAKDHLLEFYNFKINI